MDGTQSATATPGPVSHGFLEGITLRVGHTATTTKILIVRVYELAMATILYVTATVTFHQIQSLDTWRQDYWWEANNYGNLSAHMWGIISPTTAEEMLFGKTDEVNANDEAKKKEQAEKAKADEEAKTKAAEAEKAEAARKAAEEAKKSAEPSGPGWVEWLWSGAVDVSEKEKQKETLLKGLQNVDKDLTKAIGVFCQTGGVDNIDPQAFTAFTAQAKKKKEAMIENAKAEFERKSGKGCDEIAQAQRSAFVKSMDGEINQFLKIVQRQILANFFDLWYEQHKGLNIVLQEGLNNLQQVELNQPNLKSEFLQWWLKQGASSFIANEGSYQDRISAVKNFHNQWQRNLEFDYYRQRSFRTEMDFLRGQAKKLVAEGRPAIWDRLHQADEAFRQTLQNPAHKKDPNYNSLYDGFDEQVGKILDADDAKSQAALAAVQTLTPKETTPTGWFEQKRDWLAKGDGRVAEVTKRLGGDSWVVKGLAGGVDKTWGVLSYVMPEVDSIGYFFTRGIGNIGGALRGIGKWTLFGMFAIPAGHILAYYLEEHPYIPFIGEFKIPVLSKNPIWKIYSNMVPSYTDPKGIASLASYIAVAAHVPFARDYTITAYSANYVCRQLGLGEPLPWPTTGIGYAWDAFAWAWNAYNSLPVWAEELGKWIGAGLFLCYIGQKTVKSVVNSVNTVTRPIVGVANAVTDTGKVMVSAGRTVVDAGKGIYGAGKWLYNKLPARA